MTEHLARQKGKARFEAKRHQEITHDGPLQDDGPSWYTVNWSRYREIVSR